MRRKVKGQGLRVYIGRYPEMSMEQARKKANEILYNIANESLILPTERRLQESLMRSEQADAPKIPTVYELFDLYINNHAAIHCVRHEEMRKDFN